LAHGTLFIISLGFDGEKLTCDGPGAKEWHWSLSNFIW